MQSVAQSWLVYRLTGSALLLGVTSFCSNFPVFLLGPVAGVVADRFDRRKVVLTTQTLFMLQAFVLGWLTITHRVEVWHLLALAGFLGCVNAFDVPARQSLMIHMAGKDDLLGAISMNSATFNTARIVGPSLGGMMVARFGESVCFFFNGVSFFGLIVGMLLMNFPPIERALPDAPWNHLKDGLRYVWQHREVRALLILVGSLTMAISPVMVLGPVFADRIFSRGSVGLGFLMASLGLGAVIGVVSLAYRTETEALPRVALVSTILLGSAMIAFACAPVFAVLLLCTMAIGFGIFRQNASTNTLVQTLIREEYRGRVMSVYSMMAVGVMPVGSVAAGALAGLIGARLTVALGGGVCFAAAVVFHRAMRKIER
jgi:MFS family permease